MRNALRLRFRGSTTSHTRRSASPSWTRLPRAAQHTTSTRWSYLPSSSDAEARGERPSPRPCYARARYK
eukprot:2419858-Pleurochrysis_carterae.AAC.1